MADKTEKPAADDAAERQATAQVEADKKAAADDIERAKADAAARARDRQSLAAKEKELDKIQAEEQANRQGPAGNFGPFSDHPQKFVVVAEMVGKHRRGEEISYRELVNYHDKDKQKVNVGATRANADRLVAAGHLRPLVFTGKD